MDELIELATVGLSYSLKDTLIFSFAGRYR